ncbi:hypothetical protein [Polaromonas naphthalenivorans]|nr:hypothetical protein [Polaromonas naphthalenivorans]
MKLDDQPDNNATPEDVHQAIEALSNEDRYRLRKASMICLAGTEYQDPMELVHEAMVRTMSAANGGKGRHWPKDVPFMAYMIQTLKGLADDSRQSAAQKKTDHLEVMAAEGATVEEALGRFGYCHSDVLSQAVEWEESENRQDRAKTDALLIDARFADDNEVTLIIMGHKDGLTPAEIRELGEMNQTQYETARRRLRRGLENLFPGRRAQ